MSKSTAVLDRILAKIAVSENGCWEWTACLSTKGYGAIAVDRKKRPAHRVAYELLVGPIPDGLQIDHLCRNKPCVNPDHLEPVTNAENQRRAGAAKTHCKRGHEFTPENTGFYRKSNRNPARRCLACTKAQRPKPS